MSISEIIKLKQDKAAMLSRSLKRQVELYAEKTHFFYELLQNAEDAGATRVRFLLYSDRLELFHNGKPFTESNVQSLCDAANSDKISNDGKIGKFGVGFKSVFAICNTVELYSEPSNRPVKDALPHFAIRIENYTDPTDINDGWNLPIPYTTKFVFPYYWKAYYQSIDELRNDVAEKLSGLGASVLLFMKNIEEIRFTISGISLAFDKEGLYMLDRKKVGDNYYIVSALGEMNKKESDYSYLVFSQAIDNTDRTVDIAFSITEEKGNVIFQKTDSPYVSVYFPTETESKLSFIVQAPFDLTPNRSSLERNSERNAEFIKLLAGVFKNAIHEIKNRKWLSLDFINLLPYETQSGTDWHFYCLHEASLQMLKHEAIVSAIDKSYICIKNAKILRSAKLSELFEGERLCKFLNDPNIKWLPKEFTENSSLKSLHRFFIQELGVEAIDSMSLPKLLRNNPKFLGSVEEEWLASFYHFLSENAESLLGKYGELAIVPLIKAADEKVYAPYVIRGNDREPNVFIRPKNAHFKEIKGLLFVDEYIEQNCHEFLKKIGLAEPESFDYFVRELEAGKNETNIEHYDDINISQVNKAIKFIKTEQEKALSLFSNLLWIKAFDTNGGSRYVICSKCIIYRATDYNGVSLEDYFSLTNCGVYIVDEQFYLSRGLSFSDFDVLERIGIKNSIYEGLNNNKWYEGNAECFNVGEFRKQLNFSQAYKILKAINDNPKTVSSKLKSVALFMLIKNVERHLVGKWQFGATRPQYKESEARIISELKSTIDDKFLFTSNGVLVSPSDISRYDLDTSIYGDVDEKSEIYDILGFKKTESDKTNELVQQIKSLYTPEQLNLIFSNLIREDEEIVFDPNVDGKYESFPEEPIKNLFRLRDTILQRYSSALKVTYEPVLRRIRTSRGKDKEHIRLRYRGYCQLCENPSSYWEVAEIFNNPIKELEQMNLSLCPSCASEYRILRNDDALMTSFSDEIGKTNLAGDTSVALGEKYIRFTRTHLAEIQEIIKLEKHTK